MSSIHVDVLVFDTHTPAVGITYGEQIVARQMCYPESRKTPCIHIYTTCQKGRPGPVVNIEEIIVGVTS